MKEHDPEWRLHREFFANIGAHLNPGGVVILQENNRGSMAATFREMTENAGLSIVFTHGRALVRTEHDSFYFIGLMRRDDTPPQWASAWNNADCLPALICEDAP